MHADDEEGEHAIHTYCEPATRSQTVMAVVRYTRQDYEYVINEFLFMDKRRLDSYFEQIEAPVAYDKVPFWRTVGVTH